MQVCHWLHFCTDDLIWRRLNATVCITCRVFRLFGRLARSTHSGRGKRQSPQAANLVRKSVPGASMQPMCRKFHRARYLASDFPVDKLSFLLDRWKATGVLQQFGVKGHEFYRRTSRIAV